MSQPTPLARATLPEIESARERLRPFVHRTPLVPLALRDAPEGIFLKLENLQPFGSFKIRAATNALLSLSEAERARGILTSSTGNFGQGLAAAAGRLGVPCTVVVPTTAAPSKIAALEGLGATVDVKSWEDWWNVLATRKASGLDGSFVHPVADPSVVAGNATIGVEVLEDLPDVDRILLPVGGGGLASGIGSAVKQLRPEVEIVAAETDAAGQMGAALDAGEPIEVDYQKTFIDGAGGATVLPEMWPLLRSVVDRAVRTDLPSVVRVVRRLATEQSLVAEGAGATPVAVALEGEVHVPGTKTVCVVSGGNLDPAALKVILDGGIPEPG